MVIAADGPAAVTRHGQPTPDVPPLVVLHGGGPGCHAAADFDALLPYLGSRQVFLVDLPGYGGTPLRRPPQPRFTGYGRFLRGVLDALEIDRCDLLAQSLGGIAGLVLAAREPNRVRRMVIIGSQPVPPPAGIAVDGSLGLRARAAYYGDGDPTPTKLKETVMRLEWHDPSRIPDALAAARHAASITEDGLAVAADPTLAGTPEDISGLFDDVRAETLVLWGEHDPFGEPAYGEWLARRLPHGTTAVVPDTAHHPQSESPQVTATLVEKHLAGDATAS